MEFFTDPKFTGHAIPGNVVRFSTPEGPVGNDPNSVAPQVIVRPFGQQPFTVDMKQVAARFHKTAMSAKDIDGVPLGDLLASAAVSAPSSAPTTVPALPKQQTRHNTPTDYITQSGAKPPPLPALPVPQVIKEGQSCVPTASVDAPRPASENAPAVTLEPASIFKQLDQAGSSTAGKCGMQQPTAPGVKVIFEVRGSPWKQETYFHYVVRENNILVFVYDSRMVGYPKTSFLHTSEDIAVMLEGQNTVYIAKFTGIQFPFLHWDMQILLISEELSTEQPE